MAHRKTRSTVTAWSCPTSTAKTSSRQRTRAVCCGIWELKFKSPQQGKEHKYARAGKNSGTRGAASHGHARAASGISQKSVERGIREVLPSVDDRFAAGSERPRAEGHQGGKCSARG